MLIGSESYLMYWWTYRFFFYKKEEDKNPELQHILFPCSFPCGLSDVTFIHAEKKKLLLWGSSADLWPLCSESESHGCASVREAVLVIAVVVVKKLVPIIWTFHLSLNIMFVCFYHFRANFWVFSPILLLQLCISAWLICLPLCSFF